MKFKEIFKDIMKNCNNLEVEKVYLKEPYWYADCWIKKDDQVIFMTVIVDNDSLIKYMK